MLSTRHLLLPSSIHIPPLFIYLKGQAPGTVQKKQNKQKKCENGVQLTVSLIFTHLLTTFFRRPCCLTPWCGQSNGKMNGEFVFSHSLQPTTCLPEETKQWACFWPVTIFVILPRGSSVTKHFTYRKKWHVFLFWTVSKETQVSDWPNRRNISLQSFPSNQSELDIFKATEDKKQPTRQWKNIKSLN